MPRELSACKQVFYNGNHSGSYSVSPGIIEDAVLGLKGWSFFACQGLLWPEHTSFSIGGGQSEGQYRGLLACSGIVADVCLRGWQSSRLLHGTRRDINVCPCFGGC